MEAQTSTRPRASLDQACIKTIRTLSTDAVHAAAGSGHPGTPAATAPAAHLPRNEILRPDHEGPTRPERERFVISAGHAPTTRDGQSVAAKTSGASDPPEGLTKKSVSTAEDVDEAAKGEKHRR